jgi:hypothetical protein
VCRIVASEDCLDLVQIEIADVGGWLHAVRKASMNRSAKSLWVQLGLALLASSLVAIAVASVILYVRFKSINSTFREHTLRSEAHVISKYLKHVSENVPLVLPADLLQAFQEASGEYAIVDEAGVLLTASPGVTTPLSGIDPSQPRDYFVLEMKAGEPLYGLSSPALLHGKRVWVQVAFVASDILFDSVLQDSLRISRGFGFRSWQSSSS